MTDNIIPTSKTNIVIGLLLDNYIECSFQLGITVYGMIYIEYTLV